MIDSFFFAPDISIDKVKVNKYGTKEVWIGEDEGKSGTQMREKKGKSFCLNRNPQA